MTINLVLFIKKPIKLLSRPDIANKTDLNFEKNDTKTILKNKI